MLIEEKFPHAVSGEFPHVRAAQQRAQALLDTAGLDPQQVELVKPDDAKLSQKLEPESRRIFGTMLNSHLWSALAGLVIGVATAIVMINFGPMWARSNAMLTLLSFAWVGTLATAFFGGLVTLRPDRTRLTYAARHASKRGVWTVVAHCRDPSEKKAAMRQLDRDGDLARQSL